MDLRINPILQAAVQNKQTSTCMTLVLVDLENKITTVLLLKKKQTHKFATHHCICTLI